MSGVSSRTVQFNTAEVPWSSQDNFKESKKALNVSISDERSYDLNFHSQKRPAETIGYNRVVTNVIKHGENKNIEEKFNHCFRRLLQNKKR